MIRGFLCKETEKIYNRQFSRKFPTDIQPVFLRKLVILDAADSLEDLRIPPSNRLKKLTGRRKNQLSIRINDQWRICFVWQNGDSYQVEITDYH